MATRYPLIVNPSANQLQEIPFGDTLDLRGNDVNQLVVTGVSTLGIVSAGNIFSTGIVTASTLNVGTGGTIVTTTSGGLVGIRTTVPLQPLQVGSGSSVIVIDTLGELGIGTTNPTSKLQVIGDANISGVVTATGGFNLGISSAGTTVTSGPISTLNFIGAGNTFNVSGTRVDISISASGGSSSQWVSVASGIYTGSNVGIGTTNPTQLLQVGAAGTSSVVVTGIGSVGIGTANPITKLHVVGDINLDDGGTFTTTLQCVTPTANRFISLPDATGSVALVAGGSGQLIYNLNGAYAGISSSSVDGSGNVTLGARFISSVNGAASAPPVALTGTWFTGGTATTTKPAFLVEPTGTTSTAWSTGGTGLGVNAPSGFTGNLLDLQVNGSSVARIDRSSGITATFNSGGFVGLSLTNTGASNDSTGLTAQNNASAQLFARIYSSGLSTAATVFGTPLANYAFVGSLGAASNGLLVGTITSKPVIFGTNDVERLRITQAGLITFSGATSSFPALKQSSAILQARLADDSGYTTLDAQHRLQGTAPASATATGTAGDIRYDADYIYICTATNTWKRAPLSTW